MKARAKSRPKLVAQQADEYEDNNEAVFKHYDNKFFDMDSMAEDPKQCTIPVPSMEIQELQQYVTKCYDALYKDFNAFKSSVNHQLLSLQEEVHSFHNSGRNDDVSPEAVKESPSQYGFEAIEGRTDKFSQWHSKGQVEDYEEYEKAAPFHHETRQHHRSDSRSPAPTDESSPRQHLVNRPSYQADDELIQHIPAEAWSNFSTNMTESSSRGAQFSNATERKQDATYLSRHLHGSHPPNSAHELQKSSGRGSKIRAGWSPGKSNELLSTSATTAWQEEADVESKEYDDAEEENEQAIEKMVFEYSNHQSNSLNGMREKDQGFTNGQVKAGAGKERFTLHGWAATFLQQPTDGQLPKVNKQCIKQDIHKFNDKERTSKLVPSEETRGDELRMEQSVAEMEVISKRPGVALSKGSLSRSNSQDLKQAKNINYMNLNSSKPTPEHEKRESKDLNLQNPDSKFPGKKCRGGIAWTVDELAEQNKQRVAN